jgi:predicted nucleotidyltransferase
MSLLSREQAADFASLQRVVANLGSDLVVVGAMAYRAFFPDSTRHTEDVGVAIAMELDDLARVESALAAGGWTRDANQDQRWRGPSSARMDILPAGPSLRAAGHLTWPRSGMVMSLTGFDYAFEHAVEMEVSPEVRAKVIPPTVLFLLKMVSFLDDPHRRAKDLEDLHGLLRFYERDSERMFSDAVFDAQLSDVEFVPAFLLGADLAALCRLPDRALVDSFDRAGSSQSCCGTKALSNHQRSAFRCVSRRFVRESKIAQEAPKSTSKGSERKGTIYERGERATSRAYRVLPAIRSTAQKASSELGGSQPVHSVRT